ncbi:MAG: hypothetical protein M5U34_43970 [Chloroflexi bacterium]|nr:hypothetical protein [Chloroflexota bacterium]
MLGMWIIASLVVASGGWRVPVTRHFTAGLLFRSGPRYQIPGVALLPLLVGVAGWQGWRWREWRRFAVGLLLLVAALLLVGFAPHGAVLVVGTANGQFWRGASQLVSGVVARGWRRGGSYGGMRGRRRW